MKMIECTFLLKDKKIEIEKQVNIDTYANKYCVESHKNDPNCVVK